MDPPGFDDLSTAHERLQEGDYLVTDYPENNEIYVSRNAEEVFKMEEAPVPQFDMLAHFVPLFTARGLRMEYSGVRACRPAQLGETIHTVVDGETVASATVVDERSVLVREASADREVFALDARLFARYFDPSPAEITGSDREAKALRARGFQHYSARGEVLVLSVKEEDVQFLHGRGFRVSFSETPQPLEAGDFLAARYAATAKI